MVCVILQSACSHKGNHEISECFVVKQLSMEEADVWWYVYPIGSGARTGGLELMFDLPAV